MTQGIPRLASAEAVCEAIESLRAAFRQIPKGAGIADLGRTLLAGIGRSYPGADVALFRRATPEAPWERIAGSDIPHEQQPLPGAGPGGGLDASGRALFCVHTLGDRSQVGLAVHRADGEPAFDGSDLASLRLFLLPLESAYQERLHARNQKDMVFSLNHRVLQLTSLIDTGIEVAKLDNAGTVHRLALQRAASLTNASKGFVTIQSGDRVRETVTFPEGSALAASSEPGARITAGFTFDGETFTFGLFDKESRSGVIPFEDTDQMLLEALTRQVQASLENRSLLQQALDKEKMERDLALAASIQQLIIPKSLPAVEGYDIAGVNIPTKSVGGDYYDCIPLNDGRYALVVADVAGKGIPAALLVSSLAMLSPGTGEVESVNLGHNTVYHLKSDGSVAELSEGGLALGMLDIDFPYQTQKVTIGRGERLLLYSDGIPEAIGANDQLFESVLPLAAYLAKYRPDRAEEFIADLLREIRAFTAGTPQSDDITALYLLRR
ncbi:MAG: Serine phosphatase RsbU, regulator of sigma subunit [Bacteroidetes bacterium]|nr:Serine phosphatase RsbU, regulator of sigma subunit [Bacteroidota bacterium]